MRISCRVRNFRTQALKLAETAGGSRRIPPGGGESVLGPPPSLQVAFLRAAGPPERQP